MTAKFVPGKMRCLLDEDAQCIPIWISQTDGLELAHFQTMPPELREPKKSSIASPTEKCERHCVSAEC